MPLEGLGATFFGAAFAVGFEAAFFFGAGAAAALVGSAGAGAGTALLTSSAAALKSGGADGASLSVMYSATILKGESTVSLIEAIMAARWEVFEFRLQGARRSDETPRSPHDARSWQPRGTFPRVLP